MVGGFITAHLLQDDSPVIAVSRTRRAGSHWAVADLTAEETLNFPKATTIFCATNARTFSVALPRLLRTQPKRVVVISSTSVFTKTASEDLAERQSIMELVDAE